MKVITDYSQKSIAETGTIYVRIKAPWVVGSTGLTGNPYFVWLGTIVTLCLSAGLFWRDAEDKAERTHASLDELAAANALIDFHAQLKIVGTEINHQQAGHELALKSTGMTMAKPGEEVGQMDQPIINSIDAVKGVAGRVSINIVKSEKFCHGTNIEIKNVATDAVTEKHSTDKHIITVDGLTHGVDYLIRVSYDGTDKTLVWSEWMPF